MEAQAASVIMGKKLIFRPVQKKIQLSHLFFHLMNILFGVPLNFFNVFLFYITSYMLKQNIHIFLVLFNKTFYCFSLSPQIYIYIYKYKYFSGFRFFLFCSLHTNKHILYLNGISFVLFQSKIQLVPKKTFPPVIEGLVWKSKYQEINRKPCIPNCNILNCESLFILFPCSYFTNYLN